MRLISAAEDAATTRSLRTMSERVVDAAREADQWRQYAERADARFAALLDKYHALRLHGAAIPEPPATIERKAPDPVMQAINAASAGRPGLRAIMLQQLEKDRAADEDDAAILQRITEGVIIDEGVPG